jgi:hypothetical protein
VTRILDELPDLTHQLKGSARYYREDEEMILSPINPFGKGHGIFLAQQLLGEVPTQSRNYVRL